MPPVEILGIDPFDALIPPGVIFVLVYLFWRFVLRSDRRERDAFREVREQRDFYRQRAEEAYRQLEDCRHERARYRSRYGMLDD